MTDRNEGIRWIARAVVHKFDGPDADRRARAFAQLEPDEEPTGDLVPGWPLDRAPAAERMPQIAAA